MMMMNLLILPPGRRYKVPPGPVEKKILDQNNVLLSVQERFPDVNLGITERRPDLPYFTDN
jgi:hypothetical protein